MTKDISKRLCILVNHYVNSGNWHNIINTYRILLLICCFKTVINCVSFVSCPAILQCCSLVKINVIKHASTRTFTRTRTQVECWHVCSNSHKFLVTLTPDIQYPVPVIMKKKVLHMYNKFPNPETCPATKKLCVSTDCTVPEE